MQYAVDTINIEISRLQKAIRRMKELAIVEEEDISVDSRIAEFEDQIREMKKAIGVLKEYVRTTAATRYSNGGSQYGAGSSYNNQGTYTSRLIDSNNQ